jgi:hypothetical protein
MVTVSGTLVRTAEALCSYNGVLYAKTTLSQEFRDSKWVVRARLIAADDHLSDEDESWTLYHIQTIQSFKGKAPKRLDVFTYRDSGGFYLDKGMSTDLGGEYLLFLDPATRTMPKAIAGAFQVNYSCGQSKPWSEVTEEQKGLLARVSAQK